MVRDTLKWIWISIAISVFMYVSIPISVIISVSIYIYTYTYTYTYTYLSLSLSPYLYLYLYLSLSISTLGRWFLFKSLQKTNRKWLPEGRHRNLEGKKRDKKRQIKDYASLHCPPQNQLLNDCLWPKLVSVLLALSSVKAPGFPYVTYEFNLKGNIIIWPVRV